MDNKDYWTNKVNFASHCAICLKVFGGTLKSPSECPDLGTIWKCLPVQLRRHKILPREHVFLHEGNQELESPQLCDPCCENVTTLVNLKEQLVEIKRRIATEEKRFQETLARSKERQPRLTRTLRSMCGGNSDPERKCFENTVRFIQKIHGAAAEVVVKMPSAPVKPHSLINHSQQTLKKAGGHMIIVTQLNQNANLNKSTINSGSELHDDPKSKSKIIYVDKDRTLDSSATEDEQDDDDDPEEKVKIEPMEDDEIKDGDDYENEGDNLQFHETDDDDDDDDVKILEPEVKVKTEPMENDEIGDNDDYENEGDNHVPTKPSGTGNFNESESGSSSEYSEEEESEGGEQLIKVILEDDAPSSSMTTQQPKKTVTVIVNSKSKITPPPPVTEEQPLDIFRKPCPVCRKRIHLDHLLKHVQGHVGDYATRCPNPLCSLVFVSQAQLEVVHYGSRKFNPKCKAISEWDCHKPKICPANDCDFQCTHSFTYWKHLMRHETPEKNFTCPFLNCGKQFTLRKNVEYHLKDCHAFSYEQGHPVAAACQKCDQCSKQIKFSEMEHHLSTIHQVPAEDIISCPNNDCPQKFSQRLMFIDHATREHKEEGYTCDICKNSDLKFFKGANFREHYFSEHGIGTKLQCDQCPYTCFLKITLTNHIRRKHLTDKNLPSATPTFSCEFCGENFGRRQLLTAHLISKHDAPGLKCRFCEKSFTSDASLRKHEKMVHLGVTFGTHRCPHCGKVFAQSTYLKRHVKLKHLDLEPETWKCDHEQCDKVCATKSGLRRHKNNKHSTDPNREVQVHMCEECGRTLRNKQILQQHMRIHTGERPFACDLCPLRFRQMETFRTHKKSHARKGDKFKPQKTFERDINRRKI